jgi:hypothetical protein
MDVMQQDLRSRRVVFGQWAGVLGPPILWAVRFGASYALVPLICAAGLTWLPHVITAASLVILGFMGWTAWGFWRGARGAPPAGTSELVRRTRFMGLLGMLSAVLFTVVIIAEWLASVMVDPCLVAGPLVPH